MPPTRTTEHSTPAHNSSGGREAESLKEIIMRKHPTEGDRRRPGPIGSTVGRSAKPLPSRRTPSAILLAAGSAEDEETAWLVAGSSDSSPRSCVDGAAVDLEVAVDVAVHGEVFAGHGGGRG